MLRARDFYWRWVKTAYSRSVGQADLLAGIVGAVVAAIDHYWPERNLVTDWAWQIPFWILVAVVGSRLFIAPFVMAKEDEALKPSEDAYDTGPNLYIWEAFTIASPDITDPDHFPNYSWPGDQIRDWLSTGELRSWGRRLRGRRPPTAMMPIPNSYWQDAKFTYSFIDGSDIAHARPDSSKSRQPSFTEIYFNKREFDRLIKPFV